MKKVEIWCGSSSRSITRHDMKNWSLFIERFTKVSAGDPAVLLLHCDAKAPLPCQEVELWSPDFTCSTMEQSCKTCVLWPVPQDVGIKSCPILNKLCPKSSLSIFYYKSDFFKKGPQSHQIFGLLLLENLLPTSFKRSSKSNHHQNFVINTC